MGESHTEGKRKRGNQEQHGREENGYLVPANVLGLSYEQAFLNGLNVDELAEISPYLFAA